jgi:hypothetical protein
MMMKNKKALEAEVLIGIIITLIVAAVIFLFLRGLSLKGTIDKEACHQSVIMRSMPSIIGEAMRRSIPLKCKTEDILINFEEEELVKQRITTAMYDCWWMLGEGKLDFFTEGVWKKVTGLQNTRTTCLICSTIDFSDRAKGKIKDVDLTDYLQEKIFGKNISYLEYFSEQEGAKLETGVKLKSIDTAKKYSVVYMSINGQGFWEPIAKDIALAGKSAAAIGGGAFLIGGPGGLIATTGNMLKLFTSPYVLAGIALTVLTQTGFALQSQIAAAVHCDGNSEGCNMVILAEYAPEDLAKTCGKIESIP